MKKNIHYIHRGWKRVRLFSANVKIHDKDTSALLSASLRRIRSCLCHHYHPIQLGEDIDDKEFILDINVDLNHCRIVNIEMQVINLHNRTDRSLFYLSRSLNQLKHGADYQDLRPVIQISLLDYTLFPECPEFYAAYQLLNVKLAWIALNFP